MPDRRELDPLSLTLGGIEQQLKSITDTQRQDREASATYRTEVRKDLHIIRESGSTTATAIAQLNSAMTATSAKVSKLESAVDKLEARALLNDGKREGASRLAGLLGKAAHALSAGMGAVIVFLLEHWFRK